MQVQLINMTTFDGVRVKYFDLHEDFGFASIIEMDETVALDLNGAVIRSWPKGDQPEIWWIKLFDADHVVLDLTVRKSLSSRPKAGNDIIWDI